MCTKTRKQLKIITPQIITTGDYYNKQKNTHNLTIQTNKMQWGENVIIADAEYIDSVAFNLIVNFERMIGRHIPPADMAQWVECIALDGGVRHEDAKGKETNVVLVHDKNNNELNNYNPASYEQEYNGQAFKGELGEFSFTTVASDEKSELMTKGDILRDILAAMADEPQVKRVMVVPNLENADTLNMLMPVLNHLDRACQEKRITLFAMQPLTDVPCRTEILGYSLMAALGIRADEIK